MSTFTLRIRIIRSLDDLRHLRAAWDALANRLENPFLTFDWTWSWAETLQNERDLHVVVLEAADGRCAFAPLVAVRRHGIERLELLGAWTLNGGLLYSDEEALTTLVQHLVKLDRPVVLRGLDAHGATLEAFRRVLATRRAGVLVLRPIRSSSTLPIRTTWADFMRSVSSKMRQDVRRLQARARAMGDVRFETLAPSPTEVPHIMDMLMNVEAAGWKSRQGTSLGSRDRLRRFYQQFVVRAAEQGTLRADVLHIGTRPAAVQLSLEVYRRLWVLRIGFDETFAWCSPGFLLMHESIRLAHERQLASFEFLGNAESWQNRWRPSTHTYRAALVYPFTLRGLSGFVVDAVSHARGLLESAWAARRAAHIPATPRDPP